MLEEGNKVPDFCLPGIDDQGKETAINLYSLLGKNRDVVLYFYPKDDTPGCTTEACDFRDNLAKMPGNMTVAGVSSDSVESHKKFREKHGLDFVLLSDPDHKVIDQFGAWGEKTMYGKTSQGTLRTTFLIGSDGIIKKIWKNVKAEGHVSQILSQAEKFK